MAYRLEYSNTSRATCKGPLPCRGTKIEKGQIRLGVVVNIRGNTSMAWRHWGCSTPKVIQNILDSLGEIELLDGFESMSEEDQERIRNACELGKIPDEDKPPSAIVSKDATQTESDGGDEDGAGGTPSKKPSQNKSKRAKLEEGHKDEGVIVKPETKRGRAKKQAKEEVDSEVEAKARRGKKQAKKEEESDVDVKPKGKADAEVKPKAKKAPKRARKAKKEKSSSEEESLESEEEEESELTDEDGADEPVPRPTRKRSARQFTSKVKMQWEGGSEEEDGSEFAGFSSEEEVMPSKKRRGSVKADSPQAKKKGRGDRNGKQRSVKEEEEKDENLTEEEE